MRIYTPKYTKWWGLFILMLWVSYAALANRNLINSVVTVSSDLTSHVTSTPPAGTVITWHTGSPATDANKVADPTAVGSGTYFAAYYDATNMCYSPASAPVQIAGGSVQASNVCPATTVNLTTHSTGTPPSGTTVTWHTGTPATAANKVANPAAVGAGTYYAAYFDAINSCYSPTSTPVQVTINSCGTVQASNVCPATTVNLTTHSTGTPPSGTTVTWHTGTPATAANKVADPTMVGSGTYYAAYFDATNSCYSPTSTPVQVTINSCSSIQVSNVCPATTVNLTTHSTGTPPSGTTVTWHTGTPATAANKVADPTMVGSGTYYAAYFDATNSCYSPTSTPVQVTITTCTAPTNPPLVVIPPMVTEPGKPVTVCGTVNDPDIGDTHTVTVCGAPAKGTLATPTVNNTTHKVCLTYTPSAGQTGSDQVCLIVCDQTGKCDTVTVPIVITPTVPPSVTPQPPVVVVTGIITPQDSTTTTCMPIVDPNGTGTNTYTICGAPKNGTANPITTAGGLLCVTYKPNAGYVGKDSLCLIVCDAGNLCDTILIPITVYPKVIPGTPQPPVVILPPIVTEPGKPVTICGLVNDPNVGDTHTATFCNTPSKGTVSGMTINNLTHQLCLTYTPQSGQTGNDEVCVTVCDQTGKCTTVQVPVTIVPANGKPIATDDIAVTPKDKPVSGNVLTNDNDPEGGLLTVSTTPVTPPTKGTVTLNPDGTFTYTPNPGQTGTDGFCYKVCDAQSSCDTACVTVNILPDPILGNDKPIANDDNTQTTKNTPVVIVVKANDIDPDGNATLGTPSAVSSPTHGTVVYNANGTVTYTPTAGFVGKDSFSYKICDTGTPSLCDTANVDVEVLPTPPAGNQAPVALDDAILTSKNTPVSGTVAANDSDPDNNIPLTFTKVTNPVNGTVTVNADGTYTYTPTTGFVGSDKFTYKVCDSGVPSKCDTATVSIAVLPAANQAPIATGDIAVTPQDKPVTGNVLTNDKDPEGGPLTVSTTPVTTPTKGTVTLNPDGTFTYTPTPGKTGEDVFCYQVMDAQGLKDTACVTVEIVPNPVPGNDAPIAADDNTQTPKDQPIVIAVKANDTDPDGNVLGSPTKVTNPTHGTATVNADGTITYTPTAGFTGTDSFQYSVCDNGVPSKCDTATVTINVVLPVAGNQAPVAVDDAKLTTVNTPVSGTVAANDSDPDNNTPLTYAKVTNPLHGTVTVNSDGTYTYTPTTGYIGNDSYTYKVCDSGSPSKCDTATVSIGILPAANQAPIATGDIAVTPQDKPVTGNVLTNDKDPEGGPLTVSTTPVTPPTKGTVTLNPDGTFTYTPTPGKTGEDVFCYQVMDAQGLKDTACVTVEIVPNPVPGNDAPIAADDNTQTPKDQPIVIAVKANDTDPDGNVLGTPTKVTNPTHGTATVNADGTITYTPTAGFTGTDSFQYSVCDNGVPSRCDTATVTINVVLPVAGNQAPVAVDDAKLTTVNTPVSGTVAANDSDPDNNTPLTYAKVTNPLHGTVTVNSDGTYTYTPTTGYIGNDSYTYKVCDSGSPSKCDTATVSLAVLPATKVCLQAKVYLQGALFGVYLPDSLMRDDLRVNGYLPTTSPYPAMGMSGITNTNTTTSAVVGAGSPSGKDAIVDWVFVELRSATNPTVVIDSRSALLQRDGDIVDVDGVSSLTFNSASSGSYYVAVKHRNHLGVMSKTPIDLSQGCTVVDFRKPSTPTYSLDATNVINVAQVDVVQGVAMWAGNALNANVADSKHEVIYQGTDNDVNVIYQQVINAAGNIFVLPSYKLKGYYNGDINLNGEVIFQGTGNDVEFIYQNVIKNHTGNTLKLPFFKIKEQLP